ncbi:YbhB/YbcL family Raf kinase inhibitor-like protein [Methylobacterium sp. BTF04]|uniref:YbhB/YbcL family Raf kinase inhibitor-like protein n=1 Tax=Methylobacterium sp. BTF04 TaxID=2708300 RepID=UPI0013D0D6F6|nr:YbhB/YbcL family Raf kinase inhibitor-like protein [Methylobacterium sp. BTF04]NEU11809.1 YbhB/YbcL family Raf kinase inhibitor-like protein [Methylobacterium sp. BTF04]
MLEKLPHVVGVALSGLKAGLKTTTSVADFADVPATVTLTSPAFADGAAIPARFTEDGAKVSPPLAWSGLPAGTERVVLIVEDADSPTPRSLVHLIAWNLMPEAGSLDEGALPSPAGASQSQDLGQNSFLQNQWLPPDPPAGHGPHRYLFQIYAIDRALALDASPGRGAVVDAMLGHVLAKGSLTGTYERP